MYSLLVSFQDEGQWQGSLEFPKFRFLEYTSQEISKQLHSFSHEAIDCIKSWPCILMQEGRGEEVAHLVQIKAMEVSGNDIQVAIEPIACDPPILNDTLWKYRAELDIEQFEFNRIHWAVKDRDILSVLREAGHSVEASADNRFEDKPLPAPFRSQLMQAKDIIAEWGHADLDDFILEAGVDGLVEDRSVGSRRDRAISIIRFALEHPGAKTAENALFSAFIVEKACPPPGVIGSNTAKSDPSLNTIDPHGVKHEDSASTRSPNRVFVVHGQNSSARDAVVSFVASLGLEAIVLHEQPNMGRHLLTKFIEEAELVTTECMIYLTIF